MHSVADPGVSLVSTETPSQGNKLFSYICALFNNNCWKHTLYCYITILNQLRALISTKWNNLVFNQSLVAKHTPWIIGVHQLEYQANELQTRDFIVAIYQVKLANM